MTGKSGKGLSIGQAMKRRMQSQTEEAEETPVASQASSAQAPVPVLPGAGERPESFNTRLPAELHRRLKLHAVSRRLKIQDVVAQALEAYLDQNESQ